MKKVLIVSRIFAPDNTIGAIRTTKFAKYLSLSGYSVDVITEKESKYEKDLLLLKDISKLDKVIKISNSKYVKKFENIIYSRHIAKKERKNHIAIHEQNIISTFKSKFKKHVRYSLELVNEYDYYNEFKKIGKNLEKYDYVFTTYSTFANHMIGKYIKKNNPNIKWIADFRDMMQNEEHLYFYNKLLIRNEKKIVKLADMITVVSQGQKEMLLEAIKDAVKNEKIHVLYNGYDDEICSTVEKSTSDNILKFVYTGALYKGKRNMSMLLKALSELISDNKIDKKNIKINYAGDDFNILKNQSKMYGLTECIVNYGYISREKSIELQSKSDILILLSWNTQKEKGILTGKFFEYMQQNKPIVGLISGDSSNSELLKMINKLKLGIGVEYVNEQNDYKVLKEYIYNQYKLLKAGLKTVYEPNLKEIKKFHYKEITKNLEKIFLEVINE